MTLAAHATFLLLIASAAAQASAADADAAPAAAPAHLVGDIGVGANIAPPVAHARAGDGGSGPIPYLNADYGPAFARIDTFGIRTLPLGYGSAELLTRVLEDGYVPATPRGLLDKRKSSLPLGIGTLQTTPAGAVFINAYRDVAASHGQLVDLMYAAEVDIGPLALYPQAGAEYRSTAYARYYYGLDSREAARAGLPAWRPGAVTNPFVALFMEAKLGGRWYLDANLRRSWFGSGIAASPLVRRHAMETGLVALGYRFE